MEYAFECVYTDTKESGIEMYTHIIGRKTRIWLIISVILALLLLLVCWISGDRKILIYALAYAGLAVWYLLMPRRYAARARKKALKQFDGHIPPAAIRFGEEILYEGGQIRLVIPYRKLKKVTVLKTSILLEDEAGNCVQFPNSGFTGGTMPELMAFLKEKCPHLKLPDWKW